MSKIDQHKMSDAPAKQIHHYFKQQIVNFFSGLLAGVISVSVCNPLDIARTRLNVLNAPAHSHHSNSGKYTHFSHAMRTIWKEQGWRGFYSGFRTNIVAIPLFHSLFFPIYQYSKNKGQQLGYNKSKSCLVATFTAGTICNIITNPIWVVRTRLMAQYLHLQKNQYKTDEPFAVMKQMYKKEGMQSLFKGLTASLFSVTNAIIYFYSYQKMKEIFDKDHKISVLSVFISSTLSKILASTLTYPIVVVRTVMHDFRGKQQSHFSSIIRHILKQNGILGFYGGLKPDLIRLIPQNAIVFIVYQKARLLL